MSIKMDSLKLNKIDDSTILSSSPYELLFNSCEAALKKTGGKIKKLDINSGIIEASWRYGINMFGIRGKVILTQKDDIVEISIDTFFKDSFGNNALNKKKLEIIETLLSMEPKSSTSASQELKNYSMSSHLITCTECQNDISSSANSCPNCGREIAWSDLNHNFKKISSSLKNKGTLNINSGLGKTLNWFFLINAAVIISLTITTFGVGIAAAPVLLILGATFPFISLFFSKWLAKKSHDIRLIHENSDNTSEKQLYDLVDALRKRAGLEVMPEVGVFTSDEMNAFATGPNKKNALLAFSDSLLKRMDGDAIAAVVAHEIAHVANGDMLTLSIVQSVTNSLVMLVSIPLSFIKIGALFSDKIDWLGYLIISFLKFIIVSIFLFLGNLVVKSFSRKREFEADKLASELLDKNSMIKALISLNSEASSIEYDKSVSAYAAMKISSPLSRFGDIFSTHPSIERRIDALSE